jgi:hypothetical protein
MAIARSLTAFGGVVSTTSNGVTEASNGHVFRIGSLVIISPISMHEASQSRCVQIWGSQG